MTARDVSPLGEIATEVRVKVGRSEVDLEPRRAAARHALLDRELDERVGREP